MKFRQLTCVALVASLFAGSAQWVHAFYDDTHYSLTYYIARSCGYTPMQAWRIASADVGVDYSALSEPEQYGRILPLEETAHETRVRFHAIWDERLTTDPSPANRAAFVKGRRLEWLKIVTGQRNPGVMLHFLQDEEPHRGYSSWGGHWAPSPREVAANEIRLPFGPTTDFLSFSQAHSLAMVDETVKALSAFMPSMKTRQRPGGLSCNSAAILPVLSALIRENPVSTSANVYRDLVAKMMALRVLEPTSLAIAAKAASMNGPQVSKADVVIAQALSRELPQYRYKPFGERLRYNYDANGRSTQTDVFTLYGTLTATVSGAGNRPVGVSVWAAPTRVGERPYPLTECQDSSYRFDNLPVGDLIVQSVADGKVTRRNVRLERSEHTIQIDIAPAKKDEPANKCQQEAVKMAAQACAMQKDAPGDLDQPRPAENQFEQKLDECRQEEEKKTTEQKNTPTQQPPAPTAASGPSIGKILGWTTVLVGGVVGGAYVYEQAQLLAEETGSTNTNTTTTTNNPTPTSNTPSTVGLGGFSCTAANATSNLRTCTGSINVRAGTLLGARSGSSIGVQTTPSFFVGTMTAPAVGGTTGTVSLRATLASCPTQTSVNFAPVGGQPFESVSVSIPVSCP